MDCQYISRQHGASHFADRYFILTNAPDQSPTAELIIPDCTPGIMYIEEGQIERKSKDQVVVLQAGNSYLFGQKTSAVEYHFSETPVKAYGLKLLPNTLFNLVGIEASELTNQMIPIEDTPLSNQFLIDHLTKHTVFPRVHDDQSTPFLKHMISKIHASKGLISIDHLAQQSGISYKKMQRLFKKHVGITPKLYARIVRFNYSIRVGTRENKSLTHLAFESGFFDQNHFIKETRKMTGRVPSQIFSEHGEGIEINHLQYLMERPY